MKHVFSVYIPNTNVTTQIKTGQIDLPKLIAPSNSPIGSGFFTGAAGGGSIVDVVNDFYWTYSKLRESRTETPTIILKEKRLKANALVSQLLYSFGVARSNVTSAYTNLGPNNPLVKFLESSNIPFTNTTYAGAAGNASKWIDDFIKKIPNLSDNNTVYDEYKPFLQPYKNLYITEPTGWEYYMPYFDNYNNSQANAFTSDAPGGNPFLGILKEATDLVTDIAEITSLIAAPKFANVTQITFVERAKFYSYGGEGEEFSFSFPLINTGSCTFEDVVRNWELLFLLMYNNKPARRSVSIIDPPVIYQVEIPGVKFLPFCYLSSMSIQFRGTRRALSFDLSTLDTLNVEQGASVNPQTIIPETINGVLGFSALKSKDRQVNTIIPDAYVVTLTVKSLLPETKNFMYPVLRKAPIVTTGSVATSPNSTNNPFVNTSTQNTNSSNSNPLNTPVRAPGLPNTSSRP